MGKSLDSRNGSEFLSRSASEFESTSSAVTLMTDGEVDEETALGADQIICAFNRSRVYFNRQVRLASGRRELVEVGDRVMCLRNDRGEALFNGMQGVISRVETVQGHLHIDFDTYDGPRSACQ